MCVARTMKEHSFDDFKVGDHFKSEPLKVTEKEVIEFAHKFDPQMFHLSRKRAERTIFKGLIASGWHTAAMAMRMMCDDYLLESSSLGSPGIDNLRWLKPVFPGDTLSVRLTVLEARPMASRPHVGLVQSQWEVMNQDRVVVLSMTGWGMFGRREPGS